MCEYVYTHMINCAWYSTEIYSNQTLSREVAGKCWQHDSVPASAYSIIVNDTNPTYTYVCNICTIQWFSGNAFRQMVRLLHTHCSIMAYSTYNTVGVGQLVNNYVTIETDGKVYIGPNHLFLQHCNCRRPSQSKHFALPSVSTATWLLNNCSAPTYAVAMSLYQIMGRQSTQAH